MSNKLASSLALFLSSPIAILFWNIQHRRKQVERRQQRRDSCQTISHVTAGSIRPPLPSIIEKLLFDCRLAYLATVDVEENSSHLSLMRFTYLKDEEVIILSTNKRTKKFDILNKLKSVALLVHDFGEQDGNTVGYSLTLNGECNIETGDEAKRYRAAHLKHNPEYPQFIVGKDIAILSIKVKSARLCNIHDQVEHWSVNDKTVNISCAN